MNYMQCCTADSPVTQGFGANPGGYNPAGGHTGKDFGVKTGTPVYAPADGVVEIAHQPGNWDTNRFWLQGSMAGLCLVINVPGAGGPVFIAGHLSRVHVKVGDWVKKGQHVADSGNSGEATTGPHCHFEVMPDGWNYQNGTYGRINPDHVCKEWPVGKRPPAPPNGRYALGNVRQRSAPKITNDNIIRDIPAGQLEIWEGYVHGQEVTVDGFTSDIWFQDKLGFAWSGAFEDTGIHDLPDLTPRTKPLLANERRAVALGANQRKEAKVLSDIVRFIPGGQVEIFTGYVHGEPVTTDTGITSDIWYVDAKGFVSAVAFESQATTGLPDLTVVPPPPVKKPEAAVGEIGPHLNGIDVSVYQEKASLNLIASDFYFIKATEGGGGWDDDALASNVAEARLSGKIVGFYHFARPMLSEGNTAGEEARSFLSVIAPYLRKGDIIALDWEAENLHRTDWALEWLQIVRKATGALPFVYLNAGAINGGDWSEVEKEYPLWLASYGTNAVIDRYTPRPVSEAKTTWASGVRMWQYGSRARLQGYDGDLDVNVFYGTREDLIGLGATIELLAEPDNPPTDPVPDPVKDPVTPTPEEVEKVIAEYQDWLKKKFLEERGTV